MIRGAALLNVDMNGEIENLRVNGVDVVPLVEAKLSRRYPDRVKMRPTDADGFREAWDILELLWQRTTWPPCARCSPTSPTRSLPA
jgi:hypothetical protein